MPEMMTINGVPHGLATDGWWLSSETQADQETPPAYKTARSKGATLWLRGVGGIILLIVLGDFLFWGFMPGFTLGVFACAIFGVAVMRYDLGRKALKPALLMGMAVLPVIEHVQTLSVMILLIGGVTALAWLRVLHEEGAGWILAAVLKLVRCLPVSTLKALREAFSDGVVGGALAGRGIARLRVGTVWRNWAFPVGGALVLGSLLTTANPVLAQFIASLFTLDVNGFAVLERVMFWGGLGLLIWPLLNAPMPDEPAHFSLPEGKLRIGLNCGSVLRALLLFNAFLAVQSVLDFSILLGGADLPRGMSYAAYAHRGAYPLLVTAMLAGVFTFAARPYLNEHRLMKPLLLLWVAQNVLLTFSAALRLELYIAEYGLTYLRIYALIWMALVAIGLVTVLWHVLRGRSQNTLLARLAGLGMGTLYLCAFVNFSGLIATDTINRAANPLTANTVDWNYLCRLGRTANKAIEDGMEAHPELNIIPLFFVCTQMRGQEKNWRELDWRTIRTHAYGAVE